MSIALPVSNADVGATAAKLMGLTQKAKGKLIGRVMTEAMPNGATPKAYAGTVTSKPSANGLRTVLNFQRVGSQRYFDAAGFPGRTLGLDAGRRQTEDGGEVVALRRGPIERGFAIVMIPKKRASACRNP